MMNLVYAVALWGQGSHLLVQMPLLRVPSSKHAKLIEADPTYRRQRLTLRVFSF